MTTSRPTAALLALAPLLAACNVALIPDSLMYSLGAEAYAEATAEYRVIEGTAEARMVERVGERIRVASGADYEWEFKLLHAPEIANAFCLPGGKIAVYSGLLPITQDDAGLAVVMGHEVAHATLEHGNKRMTQELGISGAMIAADAYLASREETSAETKVAIMTALGLGAQYGLTLPYSRAHESEADELGLRYLVRAGYDPNAAPALWERMAATFGAGPPEFMSTHPNPESRAQRLRELIPVIVAQERRAPE